MRASGPLVGHSARGGPAEGRAPKGFERGGGRGRLCGGDRRNESAPEARGAEGRTLGASAGSGLYSASQAADTSAVDLFLRQLEKALGALDGPARSRAMEAVSALVKAGPGLAFLNQISKVAMVGLLGSLVMALSSDRSPGDWLAKLAKRAEDMKLPHVITVLRAV